MNKKIIPFFIQENSQTKDLEVRFLNELKERPKEEIQLAIAAARQAIEKWSQF
jgi:hypothetical protein